MTNKGLEPRKMPSQERSHETVEWIIEGALRVLSTSGYEAMTTNRVAEAAGISVGSLYQYFPNKDAIVAELTRRHVEQASLSFRRVFDEWRVSPPDSIAVAVRELVHLALAVNEPTALHRALFDQGLLSTAADHAKELFLSDAIGGVATILKQFGLGGESPDLAASMLVWSTWSVVHEVFLDQPAGEPRDLAIDVWVQILCAGLRSGVSSTDESPGSAPSG